MTQTTTPIEPPPAETLSGPETLTALIVACLAPMFLGVTGGNVDFARMAAFETVTAYRTRNPVDLIAIAQIIACGLAALGSLSLSMADNISLSMTLRLRGNAVALNRAAEQNRRALGQTQAAGPARDRPEDPAPETAYEAQVIADVAAARKLAAEAAVPAPAQPTNQTQPPKSAPPADPALTGRQRQAVWAAAMAEVAAEFTADLAKLPHAERKLASHRAAALSSCANHLLLGNGPPPPGTTDLAAFIKHATTL